MDQRFRIPADTLTEESHLMPMTRQLLTRFAAVWAVCVASATVAAQYASAAPYAMQWPTARAQFQENVPQKSSRVVAQPSDVVYASRTKVPKPEMPDAGRVSVMTPNALNELKMNVTYSSDWPMTDEIPPYGMYSMPVRGGAMKLISPRDLSGATFLIGNYGACYVDHQNSYICTYNGETGSGALSATYMLSTSDWNPIAQIGESQSADGLTPFALVYDPKSGADFYAVFYNESLEGYHFGKLKIGNEAPGSTVIREVTSNADCVATLGFKPDGTLYGINLDGRFCLVDKTSGTVTELFDTGISQTSSFGMAYNESDGCFYTFDQVADPDPENLAGEVTILKKIDPEAQTVQTVYEKPGYLQAKGLYIEKLVPEGLAPAAVENLKADFGGALEGTLSFTAPALAVDGSTLTDDVDYEIYQDGECIGTGTIAPGAGHSCPISVTESRSVSFYVLVRNGHGYGVMAATEAWAGEYIPEPARISNLKVEENPEKPGEMTLTWDPVSVDAEGNPIDPAKYWYVIKAEIDGADNLTVIADHLTECSYTYQAVETGQQFVGYRVMPASRMEEYSNSAAWSDDYCIGEPIAIPYCENFEDTSKVNNDWLFTGSDSQFSGKANGILPDNGSQYLAVMAPWNAQMEPHAEIYSGKISLKGAVKPTLTFRWYGIHEQMNFVLVQAIEKGEADMLKFIVTNTIESGWQEEEIDLTDYLDKEIQVSFTVDMMAKNNYMVFDDIRIFDAAASNLAVTSLDVPVFVKGVEEKVRMTVRNTSETPVQSTDYGCELSLNGNVIARADAVEVQPGECADIVFAVTADQNWPGDNTMRAYLTGDVDRNGTDNDYTVNHVKCVSPLLPAPEALEGTLAGSDAVLSWSAPRYQVAAQRVTEDFETMVPYTISDFGRWKAVDADGLKTYGISGQFGDLYFHNMYAPHAFIVFPDEQFGYQWSHSESQFLASIANYEDPEKEENWLISPLLCGKEQSIEFMSRVMFADYDAEVEVLASSTDNDPASFTLVKSCGVASTMWDGFEADLPAGTRYFALRVVKNKYMVMFDDISYVPAYEAASLVGYNVYENGSRINGSLVAGTSYDCKSENGFTYAVTAVYDRGESPLSDEVTLMDFSGVSAAEASAPEITSGDGCIGIRNAAGVDVRVVAIDGRTVFAASDRNDYNVPVTSGVYVVRAGDNTVKVLVK